MSSVAAVRAREAVPRGRPRALRLVLAAIAALAALWLVARVAAGPLLAVRRVQLAGELPLPEAEILAAAGIDLGGPLASLDPAAVRARLEALPEVRRAEVRVGVTGTVRLTLERRTAAALMVAESGGRSLPVLVDADGTIFAVARRAGDADLPVLSVAGLGEAAIGTRLGPGAAAILADLAALAARSPALYRAISEVRLEGAAAPASGSAAVPASASAAAPASGSAAAPASGSAAALDGPEFVVYLVSARVPIRARGSLDERLLQYGLLALELLSGRGILDDIQELDVRGGEVVYRMKEG